MVLDGVVDAGGGQHGIELAPGGGDVVLGEDGLDDLGFSYAFALGRSNPLPLRVRTPLLARRGGPGSSFVRAGNRIPGRGG